MGIVFRQSVKSTIVSFTGTLLGALTILGYTYALDPQAYGFTRNVLNQGGLLQMIALLGIGGAVNTFVLRFPPGAKRNTIFTLSLFVPLLAVAIMVVPYLAFRSSVIGWYNVGDRPLVGQYYLLLPVLVLLWSYMSLLEWYLIGQNKSAISIFMREVVLRIVNLAVIGLFYFKLISFTTFIVATVLIYGIPPCILFFLAFRTEAFRLQLDWKALSRQEYWQLTHFSWYHLLTSVSIIAMTYIDSSLLGILSLQGVAAVAIYTTAGFFATLVTVPFRAMASAIQPTFNHAYLSGDESKLHDVFQRSAINAQIVSVMMVVIVACNLHNATAILQPAYRSMVPVVLILLIGRLADMITGFNTEVITVSKYYKFNFRISALLLALIIGCCYLLIPRFDIQGAAWATTISLILFNIGKAVFLYARFRLQPFSIHTFQVLFAGAVAGLAGYYLPYIVNPFVDAILRTVLMVLVYGVLLFWLRPSEDLTNYLRSIREKKRLF